MTERTSGLRRRTSLYVEDLLAGERNPFDRFRPRSAIGRVLDTVVAGTLFVVCLVVLRPQTFAQSTFLGLLGACAVLLIGLLVRAVETRLGAIVAARRSDRAQVRSDR